MGISVYTSMSVLPAARRAYYRAANLIASEQAEEAPQTRHVVMDRYWASTVAFAALDNDSDLDQEWQGRYPQSSSSRIRLSCLRWMRKIAQNGCKDAVNQLLWRNKTLHRTLHAAKLCYRFTAHLTRLRSIPVLLHQMLYLRLFLMPCTYLGCVNLLLKIRCPGPKSSGHLILTFPCSYGFTNWSAVKRWVSLEIPKASGLLEIREFPC